MPDGLKKNPPPSSGQSTQTSPQNRSGGDKITATVAEGRATGSLPKPTGLAAYEKGQRKTPKS